MTKTKTKKSGRSTPFYRQPWVILTLIIIVIAVVVTCIFVTKTPDPETDNPNQSNTDSPDSQPDPNSNSDKDDSEDKTPEPDDKVVQFEGEDPNQLDELTGSVTYRGVNEGMLIISTMINQYLTKEGTCELSLIDENGQSKYKTTVPAIADVTSSVCQTFNIPTVTLNPGKYQINIRISSDQKTGTITDEVEL